MEKNFATYEISKKLKAIGFVDPCMTYWFTTKGSDPRLNNNVQFNIEGGYINEEFQNTTAPLWSQVFQWLIDNYNTHVSVSPAFYKGKQYHKVKVKKIADVGAYFCNEEKLDEKFDSIYKANISGVLKAIEIINEKVDRSEIKREVKVLEKYSASRLGGALIRDIYLCDDGKVTVNAENGTKKEFWIDVIEELDAYTADYIICKIQDDNDIYVSKR